MTLWTSPVPLHLAGSQAAPAPAATAGASSSTSSSTSGGMTPSATDEAPAPSVGGLAPPPVAAANGSRRQTLPTVPTAAAVEQGQAKWLEFAPTSPQRRASFVTEPGAVEGNPFEIYREPARSDAVLGTQSFYEAGTSYIKDSSNALGTSSGSMSLGQSASAPRLPAVAPIMGAPSSTTPPPPLGPARSASTGSLHNVTAAPAPAPTGNPFYDGAPLSPIRYNKPIAKVELSPSSHALFSQAFSDLDPLKRAESPTARVPLDQLKEHRAQLELQQQQQLQLQLHLQLQQQQLQLQQQQQQQQQAAAAEQGWGGWPQHQQQPKQSGFADPSASLNASFGAMSLGQQQQQFPPPAPAQSGWADFSAPPVASQPPQAWPPAAPAAASAGNDGFDLLAGAGAGNNATGAATAAAGSRFDPVRQKSLADASFDLGVVGYFPEEEEDEAGGLDASHASHGAGDGHEHHDEDIDGSWGGGHAEFEIQDDHLVAEDRERAGSASGLLYEVAFAAPTQFGMLLEVRMGGWGGPFLWVAGAWLWLWLHPSLD